MLLELAKVVAFGYILWKTRRLGLLMSVEFVLRHYFCKRFC